MNLKLVRCVSNAEHTNKKKITASRYKSESMYLEIMKCLSFKLVCEDFSFHVITFKSRHPKARGFV